jgi:hypothetical protein
MSTPLRCSEKQGFRLSPLPFRTDTPMVDLPSFLQLTLEETKEFCLPGLGGAGYGWAVETEGTTGIVDALVTGWPGVSRQPGASLDEKLVIRALGTGTATLHLALRRPWQPQNPLKQATVTVTVTPPPAAL